MTRKPNRGRAQPKKTRPKKRGSGKAAAKKTRPKKKGVSRPDDPSDAEGSAVRFVQPYEATKGYLCPGCNREIPAGMGHMVAIPPDDPDLRRHWHRGCWNSRKTRF